jgi:glutamate dehydrogenase
LQVGTTFTGEYLDATLVDNPDAARALVDLFNARLDPAAAGDAERLADARVRALAACDAVERLDADRILRGYLGLVEATVRTNRWMRREDGTSRSWLSLKFDSSAVPGMPKPVPHREVFVSSTEMEGVHVRAGAVARGGIRWSDRPDDYRTEILGLMKAQVVKNAVIVPTGAKAASCCAARHRTRRS